MPSITALKYGFLGLAFLLALLAANLLRKEQTKPKPHPKILRMIVIYMCFALLLAMGSVFLEFHHDNTIAARTSTPADAELASAIRGRWKVEGEDNDWPEVAFTHRHLYFGTFTITCDG